MQYIPQGVCAQLIDVELDGETIKHVSFMGGCNGNLKAICKLVQGQNAHDVIDLLQGNTCGPRNTSCADQLTKALTQALEEQQKYSSL